LVTFLLNEAIAIGMTQPPGASCDGNTELDHALAALTVAPERRACLSLTYIPIGIHVAAS
jgi:hypothetical protein